MEEQRPYLSDREAKEKFIERLLNEPGLSSKFFNAYLKDPKADGSYLEWCWDHSEEVAKS